MPTDGPVLVAGYAKVDAALGAKPGAFLTPQPWLDAVFPFWRSGVFRMVIRKGRQVFASTCVAPRVVVTHSLFGEYEQARGTRGTIAFFSTRQKEADERLYNVERAFFDLGIKVKPRGDVIEVPNRPVIIQSFPATSDVARGGNYWMVWQDEMPAWRDGDGVNPASERDAATIPGGATHPNFRAYSVGSPQGETDYHAQLVNLGDTPSQRVYSGPTWHWNPSLTEERCRELQPDPRIFNREFAAIPQGPALACFEAPLVDEAHDPLRHPHDPASLPLYVIDASDADSDANCEWAGAIAQWLSPRVECSYVMRDLFYPPGHAWAGKKSGHCPARTPDGAFIMNPALNAPKVLALTNTWGVRSRAVTIDDLHDRIAGDCRRYGITTVTGDQWGAFANRGGMSRRHLTFVKRQWNATNKQAAVGFLRRLFFDRRIVLDPFATEEDWQILRKQLINYEERIGSNGIHYRGKGLSDRASLLLVAALASLPVGDDESLFGIGDPLGTAKRRGSRSFEPSDFRNSWSTEQAPVSNTSPWSTEVAPGARR